MFSFGFFLRCERAFPPEWFAAAADNGSLHSVDCLVVSGTEDLSKPLFFCPLAPDSPPLARAWQLLPDEWLARQDKLLPGWLTQHGRCTPCR